MNKKYPQLINPQELYKLLQQDDPDLRLVDLSQAENYARGHVPHSIHLPIQMLLSGQQPIPNKLPDKKQLAALLKAINYRRDCHIIALDDEGGGWAGRFLWTLAVIGHPSWSYLNGGLVAWRNEGLPCDKGPYIDNQGQANAEIEVEIQADQLVSFKDIVNQLNDDSHQRWDARSREEYEGLWSGSRRSGHIPGAIHCEWNAMIDSRNNLTLVKDVKKRLHFCGFNNNKTITTYCQSHHRSGFTWLIGTLNGFKMKAYNGSWSEWGNRADAPITCLQSPDTSNGN